MNITLVIEYAGRIRWQQPGPWARVITQALRDRGHSVRVVADCLADADLVGADDAIVRAPHRKRLERHPMRFQRWALEHVAQPSISLSSLVPGTVWCPLDSSWRDEIVWLTNLRNPATLAMEILHRLWVPPLALAQHKARAMGKQTSARLARLGCLSDPIAHSLGFTSSLDPKLIAPDIRVHIRSTLGIAPKALIVAISCAHTDRPGLISFLDGWRHFTHTHPGVLLIVGRKAALIDRTLRARGVADTVRVLGQTERPELFIAAADIAAAWPAHHSGSSTGRFIADALAIHTPILTTHAAGGASLVRQHPGVGIVLNEPTVDAWTRALVQSSDPAWQQEARTQAQGMAHELDPARLGLALEKMLLG